MVAQLVRVFLVVAVGHRTFSPLDANSPFYRGAAAAPQTAVQPSPAAH
jgi:hypothetical protein